MKVNAFDQVAKDGLDEWVAFLQTQEIPESPRGKGLQEAKAVLDLLQLSEGERRAYEDYNDDLHQRASMIHSHYGKGLHDGATQACRTIAERLLQTGLSRRKK